MIFSSMAAVMTRVALLLLALLAVGVAGCGADPDGGPVTGGGDDGGLSVVATTTQAADLARNVGGTRVAVTQLLAANADPHDYEVRPDDVRVLADADVVVRSGGDVDTWLQDAIDASGTDAPIVTLIDHVPVIRHGDEVDPHWWQDPRNAERAVAVLRDAFARADPSHAAGYRVDAAAYARRIATLDAAIAGCIDVVPRDRRRLVTTHDALGYYAKRYGIEVIGTVIPSLSTQGQASAGETDALVRTIRHAGVRAIFAESSVNPKVEAAIAAEAGARVGPALWADTLGPAGSGGATYVESIAANTRALVDGFTGGRRTCELPD
jgi:ABC-type Zn uptake system ZnuABC Zn-binding protein ZnuA